ncbi:hypothetical protein ACFORL_12495 [Legionella dresdenensis]|uniref:Ankyrin repeats (3 copies) n=1 Tax=Legionella dresdenensis TaxID=450200 RepID=A0ABV8CHU1_9GAMM
MPQFFPFHDAIRCMESNNLDKFKELFSAIGDQSPGRETVEHLLRTACNDSLPKWEFIEYICFLTSENKPEQLTIDMVLKRAAAYSQWELVKKICLMGGDNKPSQTAIDVAAFHAHEQDQLTAFKAICEQSITKPSQKQLEDIVDAAIAAWPIKWEFIEYICFLTSANKPGQPAIDKTLKNAAVHSKWELVKKILKIENDNKPSQTAIDVAASHAHEQDQLTAFKTICEHSISKPSQKQLEDIVDAAIAAWPVKWEFIEYICFLTSANKPGQPAIDKALKNAAVHSKWELVKKILKIESDNKPSQTAIDVAASHAHEQDQLTAFKTICEHSITKPSQKQLEDILGAAFQAYPVKWEFIEYICFLTSENKPGQPAIDKALKNAAVHSKWELVKKILKIESDNKPSQTAIDVAAFHAHEQDQFAEFKEICEQSITKPSQKQLEYILGAAFQAYPVKWEFIEYICFLTSENKPGQPIIDKALNNATVYTKWELVKKILKIESDNKPGQAAIEVVLGQAASAGQLELVQDICTLPLERCPRAEAIQSAFLAAANSKNTGILAFFMEIETETRPTSETITKAFIDAAAANNNLVVQYFCELATPNRPDTALIEMAFDTAASKGHLDVIKFLLGETNPVRPEKKCVDAGFNRAISQGYVQLAHYFIFLDESCFESKQQAMEAGFLTAIEAPNGLGVLKFLVSAHKKTTIFDEKFLRDAYQKAVQLKSHSICRFFEQEKLFPIEKPIAQAEKPTVSAIPTRPQEIQKNVPDAGLTPKVTANGLREAVSQNNLSLVKHYCAMIVDNKLTIRDINEALKSANNKHIKQSLATAKAILQLHKDIAVFRSHGENLKQEKASESHGMRTTDLADQLKTHADNYAVAYFNGRSTKTQEKAFSTALKKGFCDMNDHRMPGRMLFLNIAAAATVIIPLIHYIFTGNFLFLNTKRQNQIQTIMDDLNVLTR